MNDDRCIHIPTAPGQLVCTCLDTRMTLRFALELERDMVQYLLDRFGLTREDLPQLNMLTSHRSTPSKRAAPRAERDDIQMSSNKTESKPPVKIVAKKFIRKSFPVDAIQVTPENMEAVAKWCAGTIMKNGDKEGHLSRDYIQVRVAYPLNPRQTEAYLGDWVLKSGKSFKVYTNSAFEKSFQAQDKQETSRPPKKAPVPTAP